MNTLRELCEEIGKELVSGTYTGEPAKDAKICSELLERTLQGFLHRFNTNTPGCGQRSN